MCIVVCRTPALYSFPPVLLMAGKVHCAQQCPDLTEGIRPDGTHCSPVEQWSPTLGLQMFLDYNSQKPTPPPLLARNSVS